MIAKLLPVILVIVGLGAGIGAGLMLRPDPVVTNPDLTAELPVGPDPEVAVALHEMRNQFMVPIVDAGRVTSMVVMHVALEIDAVQTDMVTQNEPRLRDRMLQVLFDHANSGGFDGMFTSNNTMGLLRQALLETAQATLGRDVVRGVLITDILRSGV